MSRLISPENHTAKKNWSSWTGSDVLVQVKFRQSSTDYTYLTVRFGETSGRSLSPARCLWWSGSNCTITRTQGANPAAIVAPGIRHSLTRVPGCEQNGADPRSGCDVLRDLAGWALSRDLEGLGWSRIQEFRLQRKSNQVCIGYSLWTIRKQVEFHYYVLDMMHFFFNK